MSRVLQPEQESELDALAEELNYSTKKSYATYPGFDDPQVPLKRSLAPTVTRPPVLPPTPPPEDEPAPPAHAPAPAPVRAPIRCTPLRSRSRTAPFAVSDLFALEHGVSAAGREPTANAIVVADADADADLESAPLSSSFFASQEAAQVLARVSSAAARRSPTKPLTDPSSPAIAAVLSSSTATQRGVPLSPSRAQPDFNSGSRAGATSSRSPPRARRAQWGPPVTILVTPPSATDSAAAPVSGSVYASGVAPRPRSTQVADTPTAAAALYGAAPGTAAHGTAAHDNETHGTAAHATHRGVAYDSPADHGEVNDYEHNYTYDTRTAEDADARSRTIPQPEFAGDHYDGSAISGGDDNEEGFALPGRRNGPADAPAVLRPFGPAAAAAAATAAATAAWAVSPVRVVWVPLAAAAEVGVVNALCAKLAADSRATASSTAGSVSTAALLGLAVRAHAAAVSLASALSAALRRLRAPADDGEDEAAFAPLAERPVAAGLRAAHRAAAASAVGVALHLCVCAVDAIGVDASSVGGGTAAERHARAEALAARAVALLDATPRPTEPAWAALLVAARASAHRTAGQVAVEAPGGAAAADVRARAALEAFAAALRAAGEAYECAAAARVRASLEANDAAQTERDAHCALTALGRALHEDTAALLTPAWAEAELLAHLRPAAEAAAACAEPDPDASAAATAVYTLGGNVVEAATVHLLAASVSAAGRAQCHANIAALLSRQAKYVDWFLTLLQYNHMYFSLVHLTIMYSFFHFAYPTGTALLAITQRRPSR